MPTVHAQTQVNPSPTDAQAVFAAVARWRDGGNGVQVCADVSHGRTLPIESSRSTLPQPGRSTLHSVRKVREDLRLLRTGDGVRSGARVCGESVQPVHKDRDGTGDITVSVGDDVAALVRAR